MARAIPLSAKNINNKVGPNLPDNYPLGWQHPGNHGGNSALAVIGSLLFCETASSENYAARWIMTKDGVWVQSGWYFSPFRGIFASAIDNGTWYGLSDTLEVVYHAATAAAMNYQKHQDLTNHGTKWDAKGPSPLRPNVDEWKSSPLKQNADMHVRGGKMAISYSDHNQVRLYNPANGTVWQTITVTSPKGVCIDTDGSLLVCSGNNLLRFASTGAQSVATTSTLVYTAAGLAFRCDADNNYHYLSSLGSDHRCYVRKKSDGTVRVDGQPGGWPYGLFQRLSYRNVVDITADGTGTGGYYAVENVAPRRIVHRVNGTTIGKEWRGALQWAAPGSINPDNVREILFRWDSNHLVLMEGSEDLQTWEIKAVWNFNHPLSFGGFGGGGEGDFYIRNRFGRTYFCRRADREISVLELDRTNYALKRRFFYSCYETSQPQKQWTDANGDGEAQADEWSYGPSANSVQDKGMVPDDQMNYWQLRGDGLYFIPCTGVNSVGSPIYNFMAAQKFYSGNFGNWYLQLTGPFSFGPTRTFFINTEQTAEQRAIPNGGSWGMSGLNEVLGFDKATKQFLWKRTAVTKPRTANNTTPANLGLGEVNTFKNIPPNAHNDLAVINDFEGGWDDNFPATKYTIDKDGNWGLGPYETVDTSKPVWHYVESTENGSGDIRQRTSDGKVYMLAMRESFASLIEVTGPAPYTGTGTGVEPDPEPPPVEGPLVLPARFNAAGGASGSFAADKYFVGGQSASVTQTIDVAGVTNAAPMSVYQSERFGKDDATFSYVFLMEKANQAYEVRLHFAESWVPERRFSVYSVGDAKNLVTELCVAEEAGGINKALVKTYTVKSGADKKLQLDFVKGSVDWAKVSGIEIVGEASSTPVTPPDPMKGYSRVYRMQVMVNGQLQTVTRRFASTNAFEPNNFDDNSFS